ncbi:unnamed protein product [Pleuronectes platessa]|uniref:Uncharacterized protein n=1 Tax=Pleuronectes platessa TaxID=8262 RepID=A0A9N7TQR4_PLEPL|nr:unnamed protein product [Pleuronectes platessa]
MVTPAVQMSTNRSALRSDLAVRIVNPDSRPPCITVKAQTVPETHRCPPEQRLFTEQEKSKAARGKLLRFPIFHVPVRHHSLANAILHKYNDAQSPHVSAPPPPVFIYIAVPLC